MNLANLLESEGLVHVCPIDIERDVEGHPFKELPQSRYVNHGHVRLNRHGKGPFCRFELPNLTEDPGVYVISVGNSVVYIGECQNFRKIFGSLGYGVIHPAACFIGGQSTFCKINSRILEATLRDSIPELWFVQEFARSRKLIKKDLLSRFEPPWNGHGLAEDRS